jgi:hypothetical protein
MEYSKRRLNDSTASLWLGGARIPFAPRAEERDFTKAQRKFLRAGARALRITVERVPAAAEEVPGDIPVLVFRGPGNGKILVDDDRDSADDPGEDEAILAGWALVGEKDEGWPVAAAKGAAQSVTGRKNALSSVERVRLELVRLQGLGSKQQPKSRAEGLLIELGGLKLPVSLEQLSAV